jgi:O-antigen/teichoic acid export membrane protein
MNSWLTVHGKSIRNLSLIVFLKEQTKQFGSSATVKLISGLAGGNLLATVVAFIGSLVQARYVAPDDLGYLRGFSIVTGYVLFLNLGLFESLHRLYPYYIGKGQRKRALAHAEIGQAWNVAVSAVVSSIFIILAITSFVNGNWHGALGWLVQVVAVIGITYGGYLSATYRSGHDFKTVAKGSVISSIVNFLILPLFVVWPYITLVLRSSLGSLINLIYLHIQRPLHLRWRFNWTEWYDLVKQGLPIFIASYGASSLWATLEMTIILHYLGTSALGIWTMSFILFQAIKVLPEAINAVYFPRIYEIFGRTESFTELWPLVQKPVLWGVSGMLLVAALGWIITPYIIPILIPKYVAAIPIIHVMILVLPLINMELPYAFLVANGNVTQQNIVVYASMGSFLLLALLAIRLGWGLTGVVEASLLGRIIRVLFIYGYLHPTKSNPIDRERNA